MTRHLGHRSFVRHHRSAALGPALAGWALAVAACGSDPSPAPFGGVAEAAERDEPRLESPDGHDLVTIPSGTVVQNDVALDIPSFRLDRYEVKNDAFAAFVEATGYVTEAELIGNSVVFSYDGVAQGAPFAVVEGADWRHPEGPDSDLVGRGDHPVVHVSHRDASAYAHWRGLRLPTQEEWLLAAGGGLGAPRYPWGDELRPDGRHMMNSWQGTFPVEDTGLDGYRGSSPVGAFPPNPYGLHDMAGNVWEWTGTVFRAGDSPEDEVAIAIGGSFLCRESATNGYHACQGYEIGRREAKPLEDGNNHVGFRCAASLPAGTASSAGTTSGR